MLFEDNGKPSFVFVDKGKAEAGLDGDGEAVGVSEGVAEALDGEVWRANHGTTTAGFVDVAVGAAKIEVDAREAKSFERGGEFRKMVWVFAPNLGDDRGVGFSDFEPVEGVVATFFAGEAGGVGELCKE